MKQSQGRIDTPIARDPVRRIRMTTKLATGREALTEYRLLEQFERFSYFEVRIGTGRTHQIRVHLASLHHPILGDRLYGARHERTPDVARPFFSARPSPAIPLAFNRPSGSASKARCPASSPPSGCL